MTEYVEIRPRYHEGGINNVADIRDSNLEYLGTIMIGFAPPNAIELMLVMKDGRRKTTTINAYSMVKSYINEFIRDFGLILNDEKMK